MISAIILAAGASERMGLPKQLLPWGPSTLLEQVIDTFTDVAGIDETIVVLGHRAGELAERIAHKPVKVVINPDYNSGMSTSIACGLTTVSNNAQGIMLALADLPLIEKWIIAKLISAFSEQRQGIVAPVYKKRRGHPVIFDMKYKAELSSLTGDVGARGIIAAHPEDVLEVEVESESIFCDIDDEDDYRYYLISSPRAGRERSENGKLERKN